MAVTIAVINRKGGVGKSTVCLSLGGALAKANLRTLLIDADPQCSLTSTLLGAAQTESLPGQRTAAALFGDNCFAAEQLPLQTRFPDLWLVPGSESLDELAGVRPPDPRQYAVRELVRELDGRFDRVLIDNAPDLGWLSWCSMCAADYLLVPLEADAYGAKSIAHVKRKLVQAQAAANPNLRILGLLRTKFQARIGVQAGFSASLKLAWPELMLDGAIPHAAQFRDADLAGTPIGHYKSRSVAAKAVAAVAAELEARIAARETAKREAA